MYHTKVNHRVFNADNPTSCQIYGKSTQIWGKTSWMSKNNSKVYYMSCARRRSTWWKRTEPFRNLDSRRFGIAVPGVMHIDTLIVWKKRGLQWSQDGFKILPTTMFYLGDDFGRLLGDVSIVFIWMCLWLCDSKSSVNLWVLPSRKDLQPFEVWRVVGCWFVKKWNPPNVAAFLMLAVSWREQIGNFRNCNHSKKLVAKIIDANDEIRNIHSKIPICLNDDKYSSTKGYCINGPKRNMLTRWSPFGWGCGINEFVNEAAYKPHISSTNSYWLRDAGSKRAVLNLVLPSKLPRRRKNLKRSRSNRIAGSSEKGF